MTYSYFILWIATFLLASCSAKEIKMTSTMQERLRNEEILAVHYAPSPFSAQTPEVRNAGSAGMMFGAIGGAVAGAIQAHEAEEAGRQLVTEYHLEDPMPKIKQSLLNNLTRRQSFHNFKSLDEELPSDDLDALKKKLQKGLVLDFKTTAWSLNPAGSLSQNTYRVHYAGRARLIRLPEGTVEWQSVCETDGKIEDSAPTLLQAVANSGAFLKSQLNSASESCVSQLELQFKPETP